MFHTFNLVVANHPPRNVATLCLDHLVGKMENTRLLNIGSSRSAQPSYARKFTSFPEKKLIKSPTRWTAGKVMGTLSPIIMVQWKMAKHLKGDDPMGDTPIFHFHDYGFGRVNSMCSCSSTIAPGKCMMFEPGVALPATPDSIHLASLRESRYVTTKV